MRVHRKRVGLSYLDSSGRRLVARAYGYTDKTCVRILRIVLAVGFWIRSLVRCSVAAIIRTSTFMETQRVFPFSVAVTLLLDEPAVWKSSA